MRAPALLLLGRALLATSRRFSPLAVAPPPLVFSNSSCANWLSFCQWCGCEWLTPISFNTTEPVFFGGASGVTLSRLFYFPHSRAAGRSALSLTPALLGRDAPVSTFGRFGGAQSSSGRIRCCPSAIPPNLWVSIPLSSCCPDPAQLTAPGNWAGISVLTSAATLILERDEAFDVLHAHPAAQPDAHRQRAAVPGLRGQRQDGQRTDGRNSHSVPRACRSCRCHEEGHAWAMQPNPRGKPPLPEKVWVSAA